MIKAFLDVPGIKTFRHTHEPIAYTLTYLQGANAAFRDMGWTLDVKEENYPNFHVDNYYKFAVIRNPWDRFYSQYCHWKYNLHRIKDGIKFNEYIETLEDEKWWQDKEFYQTKLTDPEAYSRTWKDIYVKPCYDWIWSNVECKNTGKPFLVFCADNLFRFEELENFEQDFEHLTGVKLNFPHINTSLSSKVSYKSEYSDKSIDKIAKICKKDIEVFGYDFDSYKDVEIEPCLRII
jgi:hypothetical protein